MTIPHSGCHMFSSNSKQLKRSRKPVLHLEGLELRENPAWTGIGPIPHVTISNPEVTEGGMVSFVVTPLKDHPAMYTNYLTVDGSASGTKYPDFEIQSGYLSWAEGDDTPRVIQVQTFDDSTIEAAETFRLQISEGTPGTFFGSNYWEVTGTATIYDNDELPPSTPQPPLPPLPPLPPSTPQPPLPNAPTISVGNVRVTEGTDGVQRIASFPVTLSAPVSYNLRVNANTLAGTASGAAGDYTAKSEVLNWAPGESGTKYFNVKIKPDRFHEPDETFKVQVAAAMANGITRATGTGTIVNDDPVYQKSQAGVFRNGQWFLDTAGDGLFAERVINFGLVGDTAVSADWNRDRQTDLTVVRPNPATGLLDWYVDLNQDGITDYVKSFGLIGDQPVVGDFDKNGRTDMGVVRKNPVTNLLDWYFDLDGKGGRAEKVVSFGLVSANDIPVVADWNRDGKSDIGTYRPGTSFTGGAQWFINLPDKKGQPRVLNLGNAGWSPVAGDFNGDGMIDAGLWRHNPERGGLDWLIDLGANQSIDVGLQYGLSGDQPLVGNW